MFKNIDHVYGVGYGEGITSFDKKKVLDDKTTQYYADQSSASDLNFIIGDIGKESVHVINDDGSHIPWHQAFTFEKLFSELLAPGGVYILEDIETSYWNSPNAGLYGYPIKEAGLGRPGSVVEKFKAVVDVINRRFFNAKEYSVLSNSIDHQIASVSFSRNCIIIHKKNPLVGWDVVDEYMRTSGGYPHGQDPDRRAVDEYMNEHKKPVSGTPA